MVKATRHTATVQAVPLSIVSTLTKRKKTLLILAIGLPLAIVTVAYAISTLFFEGNEYQSNITAKEFFEFSDVNPFDGEVELAPRESMTITPKTYQEQPCQCIRLW